MAKFHASVSTAEAERRLLFLKNDIPAALADAITKLSVRAEFVFMAYAPRGRYSEGAIRNSIRATVGQARGEGGRFTAGKALAITAEARGSDGYDYVGVSRWGHRENPIVPKQATELVISNRFGWVGRWTGPSVRGYHPDRDWADDAAKVVAVEAKSISTELARRLR